MKPKLKWDKPKPVYGTREWKVYQYIMRQIARRGKTARYDDGTYLETLEARGYLYYDGEIASAYHAIEIAKNYRDLGFFAVAVLIPCSIKGVPECYVLYKAKKNQKKLL